MKRHFLQASVILLCGITQLYPLTDAAAGGPAKQNQAASFDRRLWTPNRIGTYLSNDGAIVDFHTTGNAGLEWPVGSGNTLVFQSGLWLAGKTDGELASAICGYVSEFQPGKVSGWSPGTAGTPEDPSAPRFHVYIINDEDTLHPETNPDYVNWPVTDGAPVDENGRPLLMGTSTAWAVYNDFNQVLHDVYFKARPMGVEVQMTAWAFDRQDALGDMMFFKYLFINKSGKDISDAFAALWADVDIGDAQDNVGCDTTLSLGYMYKNRADGFYGDNPPAIGYDLLQGPAVPSPGDTAFIAGRAKPGFRNLSMTSFPPQFNGSSHFNDPKSASVVYNYMQAIDENGEPLVHPNTGERTFFWATGDPVAGTGWVDEQTWDKRMLLVSGPFQFADGDTQEVVGGIIISRGNSWQESVVLLKANDALAKEVYKMIRGDMPTAVSQEEQQAMPRSYALVRNFPNPFPASTTIRYTVPVAAHVRLTIYDRLGREIATLVNSPQGAGAYQVRWEPDDLPAGLYLCRLQAGQYVTTRKLIRF